MSKLIALVGPTASGKSDLAFRLAQKLGASILSCDSLIVYREMNIGTAKPSQTELQTVPHYGIDIANLDQEFTAGDFVRYARPVIDQHMTSGKPLLIVGGTGFYLKALLCGVWDAPPSQPEIRERLEAEVASLTPEDRANILYEKLNSKDAEYAARIERNDTYRVIRALEIIEASHKTVTEMLKARKLQNPLPYPFHIFGIKRNRQELEQRIIARTNQMFQHGLVNETKELLSRHPKPPRPLFCVGYREVIDFLEGKINVTECKERIVVSTRQLAKKQMTFFRGFPAAIDWFELPREAERLEAEILEIARSPR